MTTRNLTQTTHEGATTGYTEFDDQIDIPDLNQAAITRIIVVHDTYIRSLTVYYTNKVGVTRGLATPNDITASGVLLDDEEWITKVTGTFSGGAIAKLEFLTNKGKKWGPYGQPQITSTFDWQNSEPNMGLLFFSGRTDTMVRGLSATFGRYSPPSQSINIVKYEKHRNQNSERQSPVPLSEFTQNLMTKTVTLIIGPDHVEFHVSKAPLCTLPFFRAALDGEFKEAAEHKIKMPEDEPRYISAMVEFLYTGGYTYSYFSGQGGDSNNAPANAMEGSFHVGVYATAFKYDYQELVKASLESFTRVLLHLQGIDVVHLWEAAYEKDLQISKVEEHSDLVQFKKGLAALLKGLYETHQEEMAAAAESFPALTDDMLRLVVSE